jgi:hypothetical protein
MIHEWFDKMLALAAESDVVVLSFVVTTLMIILLHPRSTRPTPSFKGTISLSGLATGVTLGLRNGVVIRTMLQLTSCPRHVSNLILSHQPDWSWLHAELWVAFFRVLLGVAIILLVYFVTKLILLVILGSILNLWGVTSMVRATIDRTFLTSEVVLITRFRSILLLKTPPSSQFPILRR